MLEWGVVALEAKVEDLTFCAARIYWLVKYVPIMEKEDLTFHIRIQKILIKYHKSDSKVYPYRGLRHVGSRRSYRCNLIINVCILIWLIRLNRTMR